MKISKKTIKEIIRSLEFDIQEEAEGYEFVRINVYPDKIKEYEENSDEVHIEDLYGFHYFSNSNSDDIDKSEQIEIAHFQQQSNLGESWFDCDNGEIWMSCILNECKENLEDIDF